MLVFCDVALPFTNVPLDETIDINADKAITDDWYNETHSLNITKSELVELLLIATKERSAIPVQRQSPQICVGMASQLGPLLANVFLCQIEEQLDSPEFLLEVCLQYFNHHTN